MGVIHIENHTGLPHLLYEKTTPAGVPMDILVIRGTFDFAQGLAMPLSADQSAIVLGDRFDGPIATFPLQAVIAEEGDLLLGKPGTDVLLQGSVHSAEGQCARTGRSRCRSELCARTCRSMVRVPCTRG